MTTPVWAPGRLYNPGALVRASVIAPPVQTPPANPDFESGDTGWTKGTGWSIGANHPFQGAYSAQFNANTTSDLVNTTIAYVFPGTRVDAKCQVQQGASSAGHAGARISIEWLDASSVVLSRSQGPQVTSGSGGEWKPSSISDVAPAGCTKARVVITAFRTSGSNPLWVDAVTWNATFSAPPEGLIFKAVQADAGFSGSSEPTWPTALGITVVDNQVTWEAVSTSRVVWEAHPILKSGDTEPTFPTFIGATVADGTIIWEASSSAITDSKCPHTPVVLIAASKVFAVDNDVVRFSATVNPLDWSTANDAGYIPFGLNTYGSQPAAALGLYRSNLVVFNSEGFQMWQVDQDPANMALLDAVPAGCTFPKTPIPFSNDLPFLNSVGVRNVGIAGASTNLQADGVGAPVDKLVKPEIVAGTYQPFSITYPAAGQYWLVFGPVAFVLTVNGVNRKSWSRYVFPEAITDWTLDGNDLVLRTENDKIWRMNANTTLDDSIEGIAGNEFYNETVLSIHGNGASGSTTFIDSSKFAKTITTIGSTHVDTGVKKFGTGSMLSASGQGVSVANSSDFNFSTGDWTVEAWIYRIDTDTGTLVRRDNFTSLYAFRLDLDSYINASGSRSSDGTTVYSLTSSAIALSTWTHIALVRSANTIMLFKDGVMEATKVLASGPDQTLGSNAGTLFINQRLNTNMDDVRFTKGIARYTANFTPPTQENLDNQSVSASGTDFTGVIQWPHLDLGSIGNEKQFIGIDLTADAPAGVSVSIGYNQRDLAARTAPYDIDDDTSTGQIVPIPVSGPSFDCKLVFAANQTWEWQATTMYVQDLRKGS